MGTTSQPTPVLLLVAASSRYRDALTWGRQALERGYASVALASEEFEFTETNYYLDEMGPDLKKQFWAFRNLVDPSALPSIKRAANDLEAEYASLEKHAERRPLNLDPGYLTLAKLVLASTKDHAHRLYLGEGIYAELTLQYQKRSWNPLPWTYPDYRRADYQAFFSACRELLRGTSME